MVYARGDTAVNSINTNLRFNGDSAANYDYQQLTGTAATVAASEAFAQTSISYGAMPGSTAGANLFNASILFIPNYAGASNNKLALSITGLKFGVTTGLMVNYLAGGFWRSNAAINRITLLPFSGNFVAGTRVTIYGLGA